jgi:hypothetical protein
MALSFGQKPLGRHYVYLAHSYGIIFWSIGICSAQYLVGHTAISLSFGRVTFGQHNVRLAESAMALSFGRHNV